MNNNNIGQLTKQYIHIQQDSGGSLQYADDDDQQDQESQGRMMGYSHKQILNDSSPLPPSTSFDNTQNMTKLLNLTSEQSLPSAQNSGVFFQASQQQPSPSSRFSFFNANENSGKKLMRSKSKLDLSQRSLLTIDHSKLQPEDGQVSSQNQILSPLSNQQLSINSNNSFGRQQSQPQQEKNLKVTYNPIHFPKHSLQEQVCNDSLVSALSDQKTHSHQANSKRGPNHLKNQTSKTESQNQIQSYITDQENGDTPLPSNINSVDNNNEVQQLQKQYQQILINENSYPITQNRSNNRKIVTLQVQALAQQGSSNSLSNFTAQDTTTMKPHGIQTYRSTIPDDNKSNNESCQYQVGVPKHHHKEQVSQMKEPTILSSDSKIDQITPKRSVVSKIHIPTQSQKLNKNSHIHSERNGIKQKDRNQILLQSLEQCDLHQYTNRNNKLKPLKYLSSPDLKKYHHLTSKNSTGKFESKLLNELPPRYPFGARHGSCMTGYDQLNIRNNTNRYQLNYSINGSRKVMGGQRDSMTSIQAGDLTPVEFDVRAISRLDERIVQNIKRMQNSNNQQKQGKYSEINYIIKNKRNVKNMSPGARQKLIESKRQSLKLPDIELIANQQISNNILPVSSQSNSAEINHAIRGSPMISNATPISSVSNNYRGGGSRQNNSRPSTSNATAISGQHRKDMEKFRKLLFSQGGRRPLTSAQKEQILGDDSSLRRKPRALYQNQSIEENQQDVLRSKSVTPALDNIDNTNIVELSGDDQIRQNFNSPGYTYSQMRQMYKEFLRRKNESEHVKQSFISLKGKNERFHKSDSRSYQIQQPKNRATIKGKLHGNMPQTFRISEQQSKKVNKSVGFRQSMMMEKIEKNAASLGLNTKKNRTIKIEVTGQRKEVIQPQTIGKLNRQLGVIFQRQRKLKEKKRLNNAPRSSARGDSKRQSQNAAELSQDMALKKGVRAGSIGYGQQIIGGMQNRWARDSLDQSANQITTMEDLLHGGAKLQ